MLVVGQSELEYTLDLNNGYPIGKQTQVLMEVNAFSQLNSRCVIEIVATSLALKIDDFMCTFLFKCFGGYTRACRCAEFASEENKLNCMAGFVYKVNIYGVCESALIFWRTADKTVFAMEELSQDDLTQLINNG